jgi:hypothetical protein
MSEQTTIEVEVGTIMTWGFPVRLVAYGTDNPASVTGWTAYLPPEVSAYTGVGAYTGTNLIGLLLNARKDCEVAQEWRDLDRDIATYLADQEM